MAPIKTKGRGRPKGSLKKKDEPLVCVLDGTGDELPEILDVLSSNIQVAGATCEDQDEIDEIQEEGVYGDKAKEFLKDFKNTCLIVSVSKRLVALSVSQGYVNPPSCHPGMIPIFEAIAKGGMVVVEDIENLILELDPDKKKAIMAQFEIANGWLRDQEPTYKAQFKNLIERLSIK